MAHLRELDGFDMSRPRDGEVALWVRWLVAIACTVTLAIVAVAPRLLYKVDPAAILDSFWFRNGLAFGVALAVAIASIVPARVSRTVRLALVLPIVQLAVMVVVGVGWTELSPTLPTASEYAPLLRTVPLAAVLAVVAATIGAVAWIVARKRRGEWSHAAVMIALVDLLLLGLWLPIASRLVSGPGTSLTWGNRWSDLTPWERAEAALESPARMLAIVLVPPLAAAIGYTALAIRRPRWQPRLRTPLICIVAGALVVATNVRAGASHPATFLYINFVPWLVAAALVAIAAIVAMSAATWITGRRGRHAISARSLQHVGTASGERGELIAGVVITSWLRGPSTVVSAFDVTTTDGAVPVPAGACLAAPLPLATTVARAGEIVPVLRGGDDVAVSGYEHHATGQPFRDSHAPIPGSRGVFVGSADDAGYGFAHVALAAWRPCVAYLVILVAVATPALVTIVTK